MKQLYPSIKAIFSFALLLMAGVASAQNLSFNEHSLVNGGDGQKGAEYRFTGVLKNAAGAPVTDCIIRIENISAGVVLKDIDAAGNAEKAFQPVLEHMNTTGPSWIEFSFRFVQHEENAFQRTITAVPALAASISGLNGFDRAQEFVECDLGTNSQIVYEGEINNMMVTRNGNVYHAENRWGVLVANREKMSLMNQQITGFKVKMGITRKSQTWSGISRYNLEISNNTPELEAAFGPLTKTEPILASYKIDGKKQTAFKGERVEMGTSARQFTTGLKLGLPLNWINKEVVFDIYTAEGQIVRTVIEHKATASVDLDLQDLSNGGLIIRATCGKEFALQQAFHMAQL